ncbi:pectinesterase family protein [Gynurincola endophyticus]|uniref:pectinesterase family protein n=1 Tax=Gynurincola endophyticus TaxID=2479004 RepID=UPI000F8C4D84|nr:pectinesterase family protein [Gynurincola endophyticus]
MKKVFCLVILFFCLQTNAENIVRLPSVLNKIVVAQDGSGHFRSIQAAINSLSGKADYDRVIFVKNGIYKEKIYIEQSNIIIEGESREKTILTASIARDQWRCFVNDDWGVATMNIMGSDITLLNLTVANTFGFDLGNDVVKVDCILDTINKVKEIKANTHQMALRTMHGTRIKAINCHFMAKGGDTVSPWNVVEGMFYFKDCVMEGGVDFYCPRGWAWAENVRFIAHGGSAAIWHDGSVHEDSKTVLKNCTFEGYDGFKLGRYHRDAQFYLINCEFAANMADRPIALVPTANTILWGERIYYYNCKRQADKQFSWYKNNLPDYISVKQITPEWVFGKRWNIL